MLWRNIVIPRVILILFVQLAYKEESVIAQYDTTITTNNVTEAFRILINNASVRTETEKVTSNTESTSNEVLYRNTSHTGTTQSQTLEEIKTRIGKAQGLMEAGADATQNQLIDKIESTASGTEGVNTIVTKNPTADWKILENNTGARIKAKEVTSNTESASNEVQYRNTSHTGIAQNETLEEMKTHIGEAQGLMEAGADTTQNQQIDKIESKAGGTEGVNTIVTENPTVVWKILENNTGARIEAKEVTSNTESASSEVQYRNTSHTGTAQNQTLEEIKTHIGEAQGLMEAGADTTQNQPMDKIESKAGGTEGVNTIVTENPTVVWKILENNTGARIEAKEVTSNTESTSNEVQYRNTSHTGIAQNETLEEMKTHIGEAQGLMEAGADTTQNQQIDKIESKAGGTEGVNTIVTENPTVVWKILENNTGARIEAKEVTSNTESTSNEVQYRNTSHTGIAQNETLEEIKTHIGEAQGLMEAGEDTTQNQPMDKIDSKAGGTEGVNTIVTENPTVVWKILENNTGARIQAKEVTSNTESTSNEVQYRNTSHTGTAQNQTLEEIKTHIEEAQGLMEAGADTTQNQQIDKIESKAGGTEGVNTIVTENPTVVWKILENNTGARIEAKEVTSNTESTSNEVQYRNTSHTGVAQNQTLEEIKTHIGEAQGLMEAGADTTQNQQIDKIESKAGGTEGVNTIVTENPTVVWKILENHTDAKIEAKRIPFNTESASNVVQPSRSGTAHNETIGEIKFRAEDADNENVPETTAVTAQNLQAETGDVTQNIEANENDAPAAGAESAASADTDAQESQAASVGGAEQTGATDTEETNTDTIGTGSDATEVVETAQTQESTQTDGGTDTTHTGATESEQTGTGQVVTKHEVLTTDTEGQSEDTSEANFFTDETVDITKEKFPFSGGESDVTSVPMETEEFEPTLGSFGTVTDEELTETPEGELASSTIFYEQTKQAKEDSATDNTDDGDDNDNTSEGVDETDEGKPPLPETIEDDDDDILGEYAAMVAYNLRENLINLCGYLMYQVTVDTEPEVYFYIHELKTGLAANNVDVFKVMEVLPDLYKLQLNEQLRLLLQQVEKICENKYCNVKCTARMWRQHTIGINMDMAVGHFGYNPILNGIIEKSEDVMRMRSLVRKLQEPSSARMAEEYREGQVDVTKMFSAVVLRILREVKNRQTSLTDQLVGYILPFYPWPLDDYDVDLALSVMTRFLIDERISLIRCGVEIKKDLIGRPVDIMTKLMTDIMNSKCNKPEKMAAQVLLQVLESQLTFPDYRNTFKGVYAEINRLWELIDIVNYENYPLEIVLARTRLRRYMDKVVFYMNYPRFVAYKYKTEEETLIAFLDFLMQETPHPPIHIKLSISALKAYLIFYTGPRRITYSLLLTIIDGFMAPDLNENIVKEFMLIKYYVLDEAVVIGRILQSTPSKKCTDLLACYFEILAILEASPGISEIVQHLDVPECILRRFINQDHLDSDLYLSDISEPVHITSLLDVIDHHHYTMDTVLSAKQIKEHIEKYQGGISISSDNAFCTKQETLLDYLKYILQNNKYPNAVKNSIKALMAALTFTVTPFKYVNVEIVTLITKAWHSPFVDQKSMLEITRVEAMVHANEKEMDDILHNMDTSSCFSLLDCYNAIVDHLNTHDSKLNLKQRLMSSPELSVLNVGDLVPMTTEIVLNIVNAIQTSELPDNELEAAKAYIADFAIDVDVVLNEVNCKNMQVKECFKVILDTLRFNDYVGHLQINIIQFLLMPTVCDSTNCWWYPHEEVGSTIVNPLLQYIMYLLEHYSINEAKSLHLQMDIYQIVQYLDFEDVEDILSKYKIKSCQNNMEKLLLFLSMLLRSTLLEDHVMQSVKNVYVYLNKFEYPSRLNVGNLYYFKVLFKTYTTNNTVHVELDDMEDKIRIKQAEVVTLLKDLHVECFVLDQCLTAISVQLNLEAFNRPVTKIIRLLLKPNSCMDDKTICPWIILGLSGPVFIETVAIPIIEEYSTDHQPSLIIENIWKIILEKLRENPDIITVQVHLPVDFETSDNKLQIVIEKILEHDIALDLKKYLETVKVAIKDGASGAALDTKIFLEILNEMVQHTQSEIIIADIKQVQEIVIKNAKQLDVVFVTIITSCVTLKECVQDIFNGILKKVDSLKDTLKVILITFLATKCPKGDCPWQVTIDIQKATYYKNKLDTFLENLQEEDKTTLHVKLDIHDVREYLETTDILSIIYYAYLFNSPKEVVKQTLVSMTVNKAISQNIRISIKVILEYVDTEREPMFLQVSNLIRLILIFKDEASGAVVKRIMDNAVVFLKKYQVNATMLLEVSPVDCSTMVKCVNTLYVEMEKNSDDSVAKIILTVIKPSVCRIQTCPWIKQLVEGRVREIEQMLQKELEELQKNKKTPLHIKLDVQVFKKVFKKCTESLIKVSEVWVKKEKPKALLPLFFSTLENNILVEFKVEYVKVDLENYLASNTLPKYMDVDTLVMFGELLKRITKEKPVKRDIEQQKVKIIYERDDVRRIMLRCPISCDKVRTCAKTMEFCLQEAPVSDEPQSITVAKLIRPDSCDANACPWLPKDTHDQIKTKFEQIKEEIQRKMKDEETPVIIRIILEAFLSTLELDKKTERYLQKITLHHPDKLLEFLKQIKKAKSEYEEEYIVEVTKLIVWLQSKKIPNYLTATELPWLVKYLVDITQEEDVEEFMEMALNLIMKKPKSEIDEVLKQCPLNCIEIKPCLTELTACLRQSDTTLAIWLIHLIFPDPCTPETCPWMPDVEPGGVGDETFPLENPPTIYGSTVIVFYMDRKKLKSFTLDMAADKTLVMLEALSYLADASKRRVTLVRAQSSSEKYMLDYEHIKGIAKIGKKKDAVINFGTMQFAVVCVRYKNGNIRPLKFDLTRDGVKEDLIKLSHGQRPVVKDQKPMVTLVDPDSGKSTLVIDVLDHNVMRQILVNTIDHIMPEDYIAVLFWPKEIGQPWSAGVIEEKSPLETYLRNMPGLDTANKAAPVVITFDGIITMDFDINDADIVSCIETAVETQKAELDLSKHKKFMFYIPFPFQKNMIPIAVDFTKPHTLDVLIKASEKYKKPDWQAITITVIKGNGEPVQLQFDFYGDVLLYIKHNLNKVQGGGTGGPDDSDATTIPPPKDDIEANLHVVILFYGGDYVLLDLANEDVQVKLLEDFTQLPYDRKVFLISVPNAQGGVLPAIIDSTDRSVFKILKAMSHATSYPFDPVKVATPDNTNLVVCVAEDQSFRPAPLVMEDNEDSRNRLQGMVSQRGAPLEKYVFPFSSGHIQVSQEIVARFVATETPNLSARGLAYVGGLVHLQNIVVPVRRSGVIYHVTLNTSKPEVVDYLKKHPYDPNLKHSMTFVYQDSASAFHMADLPMKSVKIVDELKDLAEDVEVEVELRSIIVITTLDDNVAVKSFILNTNSERVMAALKEMQSTVESDSITKGIFHYEGDNDEIIPIILDNSEYDLKTLDGLQQDTPLEMKTIRIPNIDGKTPLVGFMVQEENGNKISIVLNPADSVVWRGLSMISKKPGPNSVIMKIEGKNGRMKEFYIDKTDKSVIKRLLNIATRTNPAHIPVGPIPPDNSWILTTYVLQDNYKKKVKINTRDEAAIKRLLAAEDNLPATEPSMLVLDPAGVAVEIKIDTKVYGYETITKPDPEGSISIEHNYLVIKPPKGECILLDVTNPTVSAALIQISTEVTKPNVPEVVYVDGTGHIQVVKLDVTNTTVIKILWQLVQETTPSDLEPIIVAPENGKLWYVIVIVDQSGNKKIIILDITKEEVRDELINIWDGTTNGIPIKLEDNNGNIITIHIDISKVHVVQVIVELAKQTESTTSAIISGISTDIIKIIKIPYQENNKTLIIYCNVSDPIVVSKLIKVHGSTKIGVSFSFIDNDGNPTIIYLDLKNKKVIRSLKTICPLVSTQLDPNQVIVLDITNVLGEHQTGVIDLTNPDVVGELIESGKITDSGGDNVVVIPIIDGNGVTHHVELDIDNPDIQQLIEILTGITIGGGMIENIEIPDYGISASIIVIFTTVGPLFIDQSNQALITAIGKLSTPDDPQATKIVFTLESGKVVVVYLDLQNEELMTEVKLIIDGYFGPPTVIPPTTVAKKRIIKVPCINSQKYAILFYLDVSHSDITKVLKGVNVGPKGKYNMKITITINDKARIYYVDVHNVQVCDQIRLVSFYETYVPTHGSLLIINVSKPKLPVIILDLTNRQVTTALESISKKTRFTEATHLALHVLANGKTVIYKINLNRQAVVKQLIGLMKYTPAPIAPQTVANPYGKLPLIVFTVRIKASKEVKHIVLNMDNAKVLDKLKQLSVKVMPKSPLEIVYVKKKGKHKLYMLDASNVKVITELYELSKATNVVIDAILNIPPRNAQMIMKWIIAMPDDKGFSNTITINVKDQQQLGKYQGQAAKIPKGATVLVLYFKSRNDVFVAIRVDSSKLFATQTAKPAIVQLDPKYVIVITIVNEKNKVEILILYTLIAEVVKVLVEITMATSVTDAHSTVTIVTATGKVIPIRLTLENKETQKKLIEVAQLTPAPSVPIMISSPYGPKPLLVLTIKINNQVKGILIDLNNPTATGILDDISDEDETPTWSVSIPGSGGIQIEIFVNPFSSTVQKQLIKIIRLVPPLPAPLSATIDIIIITIVVEDKTELEVPINPKDTYVIQLLVDFIKQYPPHDNMEHGIILFIPTVQGQFLIAFDIFNPHVISTIITIGQRVITQGSLTIIPPSGPEPLLIVCLVIPVGLVSVTIDQNNAQVITILEQISSIVQPTKDVTVIHVKPSYGEPFDVFISKVTTDLQGHFEKISSLSYIFVCPIQVFPPGGQNPILSMLVPIGSITYLVALDLNDQATVRILLDLQQPGEEEDITKIEFIDNVHTDGTKLTVSLNLTDSDVVNAILNITKPTVYPLPHTEGYPIIVVITDGEAWQIDANNPSVFEILLSVSVGPEGKENVWTIELKTKEGLTIFVYIDFTNPSVIKKLQEYVINIQIPKIIVIIPVIIKIVKISPVQIVPPNSKYQLIVIEFWDMGMFTININDETVLEMLLGISVNEIECNTISIKIPDGEGNYLVININPDNIQTQLVIVQIPQYTKITVEIGSGTLPTLIVEGVEMIYTFDLSNPQIIASLQVITQPGNADAFIIQIPLSQGILIVYIVIEKIPLDMGIPTKPKKLTTSPPGGGVITVVTPNQTSWTEELTEKPEEEESPLFTLPVFNFTFPSLGTTTDYTEFSTDTDYTETDYIQVKTTPRNATHGILNPTNGEVTPFEPTDEDYSTTGTTTEEDYSTIETTTDEDYLTIGTTAEYIDTTPDKSHSDQLKPGYEDTTTTEFEETPSDITEHTFPPMTPAILTPSDFTEDYSTDTESETTPTGGHVRPSISMVTQTPITFPNLPTKSTAGTTSSVFISLKPGDYTTDDEELSSETDEVYPSSVEIESTTNPTVDLEVSTETDEVYPSSIDIEPTAKPTVDLEVSTETDEEYPSSVEIGPTANPAIDGEVSTETDEVYPSSVEIESTTNPTVDLEVNTETDEVYPSSIDIEPTAKPTEDFEVSTETDEEYPSSIEIEPTENPTVDYITDDHVPPSVEVGPTTQPTVATSIYTDTPPDIEVELTTPTDEENLTVEIITDEEVSPSGVSIDHTTQFTVATSLGENSPSSVEGEQNPVTDAFGNIVSITGSTESELMPSTDAFGNVVSINERPTIGVDQQTRETFEYTVITRPPSSIGVNITHNVIYWVTFNLTDFQTGKVYTIVIDVSNQEVIEQLIIFIEGVPESEKIVTIVIKVGVEKIVISFNPYDQETLIFFLEITVISTNEEAIEYPPVHAHIWWSFTITDQYQVSINIKLDVGNAFIVGQIQELNNMHRPGGQSIIIKATLSNGKQYQLIIDISCSVTIENLKIIMENSVSGTTKPLKELPPREPKPLKQIVQIEIKFPNSGQKIVIVLDLSIKEVLETLLNIGGKVVACDGYYILSLQISGKVYNIKLCLFDKETIVKLLELSKLSTGVEVISIEQLEIIFSSMVLPSLLTIELTDGRELVPVTVDVSNKETLEILRQIQSEDTNGATVVTVKTKNSTHKFVLNINDRQVIGVLVAIGIPTIAPTDATKVRLLTLIVVKNPRNGEYSALLMDMADRNTVIYIIELTSRHRKNFKVRTFFEIRDDNGQYVPIDFDLTNTAFTKELMKSVRVGKRHKIKCDDLPFLVIAVPLKNKRTHEVYKFRVNKPAIDALVKLPAGKNSVSVEIVDVKPRAVFRINPAHSGLANGLVNIPNVGLVQASNPRPMIFVYIRENRMITPLYLNMKDPKTLNKLIEMHNKYAKSHGKLALSVARFLDQNNKLYYLLLHLNNKIAISQLSRLSVQVGSHHFVKQRIEKIATLSIPQRYGDDVLVHLNLADHYVLEQLRRLSERQLPNNYVQTVNFVDAYGNPLVLRLDFTDPNVVSKLLSLSMK